MGCSQATKLCPLLNAYLSSQTLEDYLVQVIYAKTVLPLSIAFFNCYRFLLLMTTRQNIRCVSLTSRKLICHKSPPPPLDKEKFKWIQRGPIWKGKKILLDIFAWWSYRVSHSEVHCNPLQGQYRVEFTTQGKPCSHYREPLFSLQGPCIHHRESCIHYREFPVRITTQGNPCNHYREWVCSVPTAKYHSD